MIFLKNYFTPTTEGIDVIPITPDVRYAVKDAGLREGLVSVVVPDPGASVTIIEPLDEVVAELKEALRMLPGGDKEILTKRKETVRVGARIRAAMLGRSLSLPLKEGELVMGSREDIVVIDFERDGRRRAYAIQVMGEGGGESYGGMPLGAMGGEE